jgi:hypothetical protein
MTIQDDREEFQKTGLVGLLNDLMRSSDQGFARVLPGGWRGELVDERPSPGSGPFIEYRRGSALMLHHNSPENQTVEEYRLPRI